MTGFVRLFFGFEQYDSIRQAYFTDMNFLTKTMAVLLMLLLIAIPVLCIVLIVRRIIVSAKLRVQSDDNVTLYKEIERLNKQVMTLMDEKNMILALKTGSNTAAAIQS